MKLHAFLCLLLLTPLLWADETSHREAAAKLVESTGADKGLEQTLPNFLEPTLQRMRQQGLPEDLIQEVKTAVTNWFQKEIKWEEVKPKVIDVWAKNYSEQELSDLSKFFGSESGKKFLEKMPQVMQESSQTVQAYMQSKQASLQSSLAPLIERAKAAGGSNNSGTTNPTPPPPK